MNEQQAIKTLKKLGYDTKNLAKKLTKEAKIFSIDKGLYEQLQMICKKQDVSASSVVNEAINKYVKSHSKKRASKKVSKKMASKKQPAQT